MKKVFEVNIIDNDNVHAEYLVGIYTVYIFVIPYKMYEDILIKSRLHDVYFAFSDIINIFVHAVLYGSGSAVSIDCSMFLSIVEITEDFNES